MNIWEFLNKNGVGVLFGFCILVVFGGIVLGAWADAWSKAHSCPCNCVEEPKR